MSTTLTVETGDLRRALQAVAGHASRFTDDAVLRRVRLTFDRLHVTVTATNRYSAGLSIVSVWDDAQIDDEHAVADLTPSDVGQILAVFTGQAGTKGEVGDTVRLELDLEHLILTDTGGLFEGKSLTLPRLPLHDYFPNVARLIRVALDHEPAAGDDAVLAPVWTNPRLLSLFKAAGGAWGLPLILEPTGQGRAIVVRCGEDFLGLLMPVRPDDDEQARAEAWRSAWLTRLAEPESDDPDTDRARSWLAEGHGVIVFTTGQQTTVTIGDGMRDDERAQLAAAVRAVVTEQDCRPSTIKRRCRVSIAEARALLAKLIELEVVEQVNPGEDPQVIVAEDALQTCLAEHGLEVPAEAAPEPVPAG